jgi:inositol-hexakisphosphate/diphosphoinositol-pentakisphosphate 1-kinase
LKKDDESFNEDENEPDINHHSANPLNQWQYRRNYKNGDANSIYENDYERDADEEDNENDYNNDEGDYDQNDNDDNDDNEDGDENQSQLNNNQNDQDDDDQDDCECDDLDEDEDEEFEVIKIGVCAMEKKVRSKPMGEILKRLDAFEHFEINIWDEDVILNRPIEEWPKCDVLISFYSKGFPLKKAQDYSDKYSPYLVNDIEKQWDIMDRTKVYQMLTDAGIEQPRYAIKRQDDKIKVNEQEDQIEIDGQIFYKPFVEKPVNADDHNIYIYFPSTAGGGSQRLFRKVEHKSSVYSQENKIRRNGSYIYEEFMPTDGTDVKVYTVGDEYAHAEARKSPALDGKVERDENGKEKRYPVMLRAEEKIIAKRVVMTFKQAVCGFDLLRANGKSYVCDVNGFSFVKNSIKYYEDCSSILSHVILKAIAPQRHIPNYVISNYSQEEEGRPIVPTNYGKMMELRCVIAVMRHGDRTPKQKLKMEVKSKLFFDLFKKYISSETTKPSSSSNHERPAETKKKQSKNLKLKKPSQLQEVLDIVRSLLKQCADLKTETLPTNETRSKLLQVKCVLEMYGHFSGINRKIQLKYQPNGKPKCLSSDELDIDSTPNNNNNNKNSDDSNFEEDPTPSLLLVLKWGGELTADGRVQAEELGTAFRKLYPGGTTKHDSSKTGFLRLHSTYRHDLKIYASDEGRVQMTAAAFAKGLLALDGELAPILVQMVKSANTNGLLDNDTMSSKRQNEAKKKLASYLTKEGTLSEEDKNKIDPTNNYSIRSSLDYIQDPVKICQRVHGYVIEIINLIRHKITNGKYYDLKLYHEESWELMLRRWTKLEKDFFNKKKKNYEISKIPDIYDSIKYDLMHNRNILDFPNANNLYKCAKALADVVIPQEYGLNREEKLCIAQGIITPLLRKIKADLMSNLTGIWNNEDTLVNQLDPRYS